MEQQITEGISISVETEYQQQHSKPMQGEYFFAYQITIENLTDAPIRLLRRKWHIIDSLGSIRIVAGEGVIGQQPLIEPGGHYQYCSGANLRSELGKMYGTYEMEHHFTKKIFTVQIPKFQLIAPMKLN